MAAFLRNIICTVLFLGMISLPMGAQATIYAFIDEDGGIHLTNVPIDPRYQPGLQSLAQFKADRYEYLYESYIRGAARMYEVDPLLIKAVIKAESNFNRLAISKKGAKGLMQLMPDTAKDMNVANVFDPESNILGGTQYLRKMLTLFQGNITLALAAYNAGPERVKEHGRVPSFPETKQYIQTVLHNYQYFQENTSPHKKWVKVQYD
ncbi:MAG: lytic transglycosylase domain-containing protein [Proteobacteria bacterium]|nr:lytic transglycosylase domain-containing protein [Pseudomonadota bacterium]MBU1709716.1 lytic transglycosylase domain-containing protein [Pseudomonadota bacterium]